MTQQKFNPKTKLIMAICLLAVFLVSCDQIKEKISAAIHPKSSQETLNLVNSDISQKKYKDALMESEILASDKNEPLRGQFAYASAKSSAQIGDYEKTYIYLIEAIELKVVSPTEIMNEPLFQSIKNDDKFIRIFNLNNDIKPINSNNTDVSAGNNVSIKIDSNGTHIKAGNITLNQP